VVEAIACRWRGVAVEAVVRRHELVEARRAELAKGRTWLRGCVRSFSKTGGVHLDEAT
jgi:hypothetical protein